MTGSEVLDVDPYLWLEEVDGERALAWVAERNAELPARLTSGERFDRLREEIRAVLDSAERIPYVTSRGEYRYNLWRDAEHPRGLWRRTTLDEYRSPEPSWEVLIDLDELAAAEGESWVWQGATALRPANERFLVSLSRGGSDANVVREFSAPTRSFVEDGFTLPEAKSDVAWIDADTIFVGTDTGPGSLTSSGYPRRVLRWRRGTPLAEAALVYEGEADDMAVGADHDPTPGFERSLIVRRMDFYRSWTCVAVAGAEPVLIEVPEDATVDLHREWLLIRVRTEWSVAGATYPGGTLLVTRLDAFLAGERDLTVLFEPDEHTALSYWAWTRSHLLLALLSDVHSRIERCDPARGWRRTPISGLPEFAQTDVSDTEQHDGDGFMLASRGFLDPVTLFYGTDTDKLEPLRREPAFFDPAGLAVRQYLATSADGTAIPYFVVGDPAAREAPALLTGYGGFEVSRTPQYDGSVGRAWLARGGVYVLANIRGGGEYGPRWHLAALRERRPRAYEDFAAVATDLVERGITTPARLGAEGGSNGGLLMGVMLTRYPHLFGAIVAHVPLFDMRRYHLLLAGASWMAEYGNPDDAGDWEFIGRYSPYQQVRSGQTYPPLLVTTSTRDDRVHPGHARKMVARLRELGYDVTYYENVEGGHGGAADNAQLAFQRALGYEFLWRVLTPDG